MARKFDSEKQAKFLVLYAQTGLTNKSARAVGVCPQTVRDLEKADETFAALKKDAYRDFCDRIEEEVRIRAVEGWREPVFYQGEVVGEKLVKSDRILELAAKRHIPAYRDKQTIDMNLSGGVLVVPAAATTVEEWEAKQRKPDEQ